MKRYMVKFHYPNSTTVHTAYESASSRSEAANKVKAREAGCGRIVKIIATIEREGLCEKRVKKEKYSVY